MFPDTSRINDIRRFVDLGGVSLVIVFGSGIWSNEDDVAWYDAIKVGKGVVGE